MSRLALALSLVFSVLIVPEVAEACGNSIELATDVRNDALRSAEKLLAAGKHKKAIEQVHKTFRDHVLQLDRYEHLQLRAQRILALAVVRSKGEVVIGQGIGGKTDAQRRSAIAWATLMLRLQHSEGATPALTAELAEALALQGSSRGEAHRLLKELGDGDLMPGAEGWALLGELSRERGDGEGSKKAIERCKQIGAAGVQCEVTQTS